MKKLLTSSLLALAISCNTVGYAATFSDTHNFPWAENAIEDYADRGIITGTGWNEFSPQLNIRRGDFCLLIYRLINFEGAATTRKYFLDVPQSAYYYDAIGYVANWLSLSGYEDGTFRPEQPITRAEIAVMLDYITYCSKNDNSIDNNAEKDEILGGFSDANFIPNWAEYDIAKCVKAGYMKGDDWGNFNPSENLRRAEAAVIFKNIEDNWKEDNNTYIREKYPEPELTPTPLPTPTTTPALKGGSSSGPTITPTPEIKEIDYDISKTQLVDLNYNESTLKYANPNRGFFVHLSFSLPNTYNEEEKNALLTRVNSNLGAAEQDNLTLSLLIITLDQSLNNALNNDSIEALNDILEVHRKHGFRTIIRFRYGRGEGTEPGNFSTMLEHIEQVGPTLKNYDDVISVYQAGYIGAYGEWHTSKYNDVTYENQILDAMFENSSPLTEIAVREPKDYRNYLLHVNNNEEVIKRFGQYNDAFLSTASDMGTYDNREEDIEYMSPFTVNTFFGGEAVYSSETYSNLTNVNKEMRLLHTNYLNTTHDLAMLEYWKGQTVTEEIDEVFANHNGFDYIFNRLGYRFVLKESRLTDTVKQGDALHLSFSVENTGFGNPLGINNTYLLLEKDGMYYRMPLNINPEEIKCGSTKTYNLVARIPFDLNPSEWNVYIQMSSNESAIDDPDIKFVKFANYDLYNSNIRGNYIGSINVQKSSDEFKENSRNNFTLPTFEENGFQDYLLIDGKLSSDRWNEEWGLQDIIYDESGLKVYAKIKSKYLHIFVIDDILKPTNENTPYINLLFDTGLDEPYKYDRYYTFRYENRGFFGRFNENSEFTSLPVTYKYSVSETDGYEYRIELSDMNITKLSDIKKMRISLYDKNWDSNKRIVIE
ncbi:MAG: DUF4832 domain-containing protein [Clostridiales bacterium]|nr:DUF4832 domain-containing protein [Clostridiales bacterium]